MPKDTVLTGEVIVAEKALPEIVTLDEVEAEKPIPKSAWKAVATFDAMPSDTTFEEAMMIMGTAYQKYFELGTFKKKQIAPSPKDVTPLEIDDDSGDD